MSNISLIVGLNFLSLLSNYAFEIWGKYSFEFSFFDYLLKFAYVNSYPILIALVFAYIINLYKKSKSAEIENIKLKEEKIKAELSSLKEQISSHFFFNTLSSLSHIIRSNEKNQSLEFVEKLSEVYRYILESNQKDLVNLKDELEFLNAYFFLLDKRFGKKLIVQIDITSDLYLTSIPPMALQLLAENAIQHNSITSSAPLKIKIFNDDNMICVENNLQKKETGNSTGIGLNNLLKRYQLIANKVITIKENKDRFIVKLPVIK
jgi:LytS/YehU family sensor histidine kinase